jgi:simple sugar transport system permease protein
MVRESESVAAYAGIPIARRIVGVMLVGGALGGLAGAAEMMGNTYQYSPAISANTGYIGIVVAILAAGSALGAVPIAVLFASIIAGGNALSTAGVESNLVIAVMGLMLLIAAVGDGVARWRIVRRRDEPPAAPPPSETPEGRRPRGETHAAVNP